jgi:hypothetical protein
VNHNSPRTLLEPLGTFFEMEQAQVSNDSSHAYSGPPSSDVGMSIAHHFDEFRRQKRPFDVAFAAAVPASPALHAASARVSGFRIGHHCCRICKTLLPATSFYPSNLKRSTFYCKSCCNAKKQANTQCHRARLIKGTIPPVIDHANCEQGPADPGAVASLQAAAATHRGHGTDNQLAGPAHAALKMLNRLRRMCARPSECGLRLVLPNPVSLNFDAKVARQLLLWWNSTSALGPAPEGNHEMCFVPWLPQLDQRSLTALQPWEVIPVTRVQARRLTSTPPDLWMQLLDPAAAAHVVTKSAELKRIILGEA